MQIFNKKSSSKSISIKTCKKTQKNEFKYQYYIYTTILCPLLFRLTLTGVKEVCIIL